MLKKSLSVLLIGVLLIGGLFAISFAQEKKVSIAVTWSGEELQAFKKTIKIFEEETGIDVTVESVGRDIATVLVTRVEGGNPPDVAAIPNPGQMEEFVKKDALVSLDESIVESHPEAFVDLASVDGDIYGIFLSADLKSLVWYNPKEFEKHDYEVPETWGELTDLSDQIVADGGTPWCIGLESGPASGWPGTDWIEDIMLRTAGPDMYDAWVNHDIEWTDAVVHRAWEKFGSIVKDRDYVFGGPTGALTINFGDSVAGLFTDPPRCYMHRQATFIQSFIKDQNPDLVAGEDYDVFVLPSIDKEHGNPLLGAGDLVSAFNDTPAAHSLMEFLASAEAQEVWVKELGKLAVNTKVSSDAYPDPITAKTAKILSEAEIFRFDGSDLMPSAVGSGTFWTGIMDYVSGEDLEKVLKDIERSADEAY
ncbi:carbohydrate ABC transporter substrate-binding protein [Candidatus Bipolaricaulota bacterium]|nr:carbohydrate ABC transporter substrate-binding protein [Candidatus Bipolaricaulota bacterium]MBS3792962.1 carbohydrate ABC transporter substrate-binding protein [Candidatus Bipolaricaulota bacterium]